MSKYDLLGNHLGSLDQDRWTASLSEIDRILGSALPHSARVRREWWGNERSGTHSQARAWMKAGWLVHEVSLGQSRVTFQRSRTLAGAGSLKGRMAATPP